MMEGYRRREAVAASDRTSGTPLHSQLNYAELRKKYAVADRDQSLFTPKMLLALVLRMAIWSCLEQARSDSDRRGGD